MASPWPRSATRHRSRWTTTRRTWRICVKCSRCRRRRWLRGRRELKAKAKLKSKAKSKAFHEGHEGRTKHTKKAKQAKQKAVFVFQLSCVLLRFSFVSFVECFSGLP